MKVSGQLPAPAALPRWPFDTRQGGADTSSGLCEEENKPLRLPVIERRFLDNPARGPVTIPTCKILQDMSFSQWWR